MKLSYFPDTDSLCIDLSDDVSTESREISDGIVLDFGANVQLVGIDIDEASRHVQLGRLVLTRMPSTVETTAA